MKRNIVAFIAVVAVTLVLIGCSPEDRARKLMEKGKYEEILNDPKMKDLPIAKEARVKYADKLLANGKFEEAAPAVRSLCGLDRRHTPCG